MREPTEQLIDTLAESAQPTRFVGSPALRTVRILVPLLATMFAAALLFGEVQSVFSAFANSLLLVSLLSALLTGATAAYAAFSASVPGQLGSRAWIVIPPATAWLLSNASMCTAGMQAHQGLPFSIFLSLDCFTFISIAGGLSALVLLIALRHSVAVNAVQVAIFAGLSAATLATALLSFFHPPETDFIDLITHLTAIFTLTCAMAKFAPRTF